MCSLDIFLEFYIKEAFDSTFDEHKLSQISGD